MSFLSALGKQKKTFLILLGVFVYGTIVTYAVPPTTPYAENETLDPNCGPTDTNCFIESATSPWMSDGVNTYVSSGNVGIGTINPQYPLDIVGTSSIGINYDNASGHALVRVNGGDAYQSGYYIHKDGSEVAQMAVLGGSQDLSFSMAGTERMRITNAGNIGIGISNPAALLDVSGTLHTTGIVTLDTLSGSGNRMVIADSNGVLSTQSIPSFSLSSYDTDDLTEGDTNLYYSDDLVADYGDANYVQLAGSYTNPSWLSSLAWSKITATPTTLSGYGITDAAPLSGGANYIQNQASTDQAASLRINGTASIGGNVGIGTSTPSAKLQVVGNVDVGLANANAAVRVGFDTNNYISMGFSTGSPYIQGVDSNLGNGGPLALNPSGGNVAIGTNLPSAKLDVLDSATGQTGSQMVIEGRNTSSTYNTTLGALTSYTGYFNNTATRSTGANNLTNVGLYVNAVGAQNNYAAIFENGNIGIGTTTPAAAAAIHISRDSQNFEAMRFSRTGTGAGDVTFQVSNAGGFGIIAASNFYVQSAGTTIVNYQSNTLTFSTNSTSRMIIDSLGNIGVGLTPSASRFEVTDAVGSQTATRYGIRSTNGSATFNTTSGTLTSYGGFFTSTSTRSAGANNLTNVGLYASASGAQTNYAAIFENGTVGIGTSTPAYKLTVSDTGGGFIAQFTDGTRDARIYTASGFVSFGSSRIGDDWRFFVDNNSSRGISIKTGTGNLGVGAGSSGSRFQISDNLSTTSWTTVGVALSSISATYTDTSSAAAAVVATRVGSSFAQPTFTSTNAITVTSAANLYIAGAPIAGTNTSFTNSQALYVAAGSSYFGGNLGIATLDPTNSLTIGSTGTGISLYNSVDQVTNYERLRIGNGVSGNGLMEISAEKGGTGIGRGLELKTIGTTLRIGGGGASGNTDGSGLAIYPASSSTTTYSGVTIRGTTLNATSGEQRFMSLYGTVAQTSTAGYRGIYVSPFLNSTGSGVSYLVDIGTNTVNSGAVATHTSRFVVTGAGFVGIGTTSSSPSYLLQVGSSAVSGITARFENSTGTCDINPTSSALSCSSDATLKKNITALDNTILDKVLSLRPVTYAWNNEDDGASHVGFIAQEVRDVFPGLVSEDKDTGLLSLNYIGLVPYTIKALQDVTIEMNGIDNLEESNSLREGMLAWFGNVENTIETFFSKKVTTEQLCVRDEGGETCITRSQLNTLLQGQSSYVPPVSDPEPEELPPAEEPADTSPEETPVTPEDSNTAPSETSTTPEPSTEEELQVSEESSTEESAPVPESLSTEIGE